MVLTPRMAQRFSRKCESTHGSIRVTAKPNGETQKENEENINLAVYRRMETIMERMQDEYNGVPVKTVKSFMSKIPSVFTGTDLVAWIMRNLDADDQTEALHLAHLMAAHGYLFPIDDHILTVRNDNTFYRFQTPFFWPSNNRDPENYEYAVYLCKRTMQNKQRLELADYEAENLARLQKVFSRKWEFIFMQAEAQAKVDKKRDKLERKVLDSQERAFWDVNRPAPGCVNTTEVDIKKACKSSKPSPNTRQPKPHGLAAVAGQLPTVVDGENTSSVEQLKQEVTRLQTQLDRRRVKVSKVADSFIAYFEQYAEFDSLVVPPDPANPWTSDNTEFWEQDVNMREIPARRVRRWGFSIHELLKDPAGREHFGKFLEKEFSAENLKFWAACQDLRVIPQKDVTRRLNEIYNEFLVLGAPDPVNIDCKVSDSVRKKVENCPDRYCFEEAVEHIFQLMKADSYSRYLRSDMYKEFLSGTKKKSKRRFASEVRRLRAAAAAVAIAGGPGHVLHPALPLQPLSNMAPHLTGTAAPAGASSIQAPPPRVTLTPRPPTVFEDGDCCADYWRSHTCVHLASRVAAANQKLTACEEGASQMRQGCQTSGHAVQGCPTSNALVQSCSSSQIAQSYDPTGQLVHSTSLSNQLMQDCSSTCQLLTHGCMYSSQLQLHTTDQLVKGYTVPQKRVQSCPSIVQLIQSTSDATDQLIRIGEGSNQIVNS